MRTYRQWAGEPRGVPEDPKRCAADVADGGRSCLSHQCLNPRKYGLLCGVHKRQQDNGRHVWIWHVWIPPDKPEGDT